MPGVGLFVLALVLCWSTTAEATFPGTPGKIAITVGGPADIFVMNPDGSGLVNVTNTGDIAEEAPEWSPDGQRLLFTRVGEQAWVTNADGTITTPLPIARARHASWSPDGQKVVFVRPGGGGTGCGSIHTADLIGTFETLVVPANAGPCFKIQPAWSPAGGLITYYGYDPVPGFPDYHVYTVNVDGSNVSGPIAQGRAPEWSPAGHRIMYDHDVTPDGSTSAELYTVNSDGSGKLRLNPFTGVEGDDGAWSPDGTRVVFSMNNGLGITDDAGGNPSPQINEFGSYQPDWQPTPVLPPEDAGYPRPRGATPFSVSLVPAYRECTSANRTHGGPFSYGSCSSPQQASDALTVGTPDANGRPAGSIGSVTFKTIVGDPVTTTDEADVQVNATLTDVRCRIALSAYCAGGALSDYHGGLELEPTIRITDRRSGGLARDPATGSDVVSFSVPVSCSETPSSTAGSVCSAQTTLDALAPGTIAEEKRSIWELGQMTVRDAGIDDPQVEAFATFAVQGVFVP